MTTATDTNAETDHLTKADQYRREISSELSGAMEELKERKRVWEDLKTDTKEAKADVEAAQREVNRLAGELHDIEHGTYQPRLIPQPRANGKPTSDAQTATKPVDEAASTLINALTEYDLEGGQRVTPKVCELLQNSKFEIKTIGDLERTMREKEYWHRDCEGIGPKGIDKVVEALAAFRRANPMPSPDDLEPAEASGEPEASEASDDQEPEVGGDVPDDVPV